MTVRGKHDRTARGELSSTTESIDAHLLSFQLSTRCTTTNSCSYSCARWRYYYYYYYYCDTNVIPLLSVAISLTRPTRRSKSGGGWGGGAYPVRSSARSSRQDSPSPCSSTSSLNHSLNAERSNPTIQQSKRHINTNYFIFFIYFS